MQSAQVRLKPISALLFGSRWLQLPLYLGLIVAQAVYVYLFWVELSHLVLETPHLTEEKSCCWCWGSSTW